MRLMLCPKNKITNKVCPYHLISIVLDAKTKKVSIKGIENIDDDLYTKVDMSFDTFVNTLRLKEFPY